MPGMTDPREQLRADLRRFNLIPPEAPEATSVRSIDFSVRAHAVLDELGAATLGDVARLTRYDLWSQRNCGAVTIRNIEDRLAERGLALRGQKRHTIHP